MRTIGLCFVMLVGPAGCTGSAPPDPSGPASTAAQPVSVFAAASTGDVLRKLAARFEGASGIPVTLNLAGSSTLAQQIENGADASVFISASPDWMDRLDERGLIDRDTRIDLLSNRLVIVLRRDVEPPDTLEAILAGRVAAGDPEHVPAGIYARQALMRMDLWDGVAGRLVRTIDVRAALRLAELGEAAAIVYETDAASSDRVVIAWRFDPALHDPIVYPAACCTGASPAAAQFLEYLRGGEAWSVFAAAGFGRPSPPGGAP